MNVYSDSTPENPAGNTSVVAAALKPPSIEDLLMDLARLYDARRLGPNRFRALCSSHPDKTPSLDLGIRNNAIVILCRAGCSTRDVLAAKGLTFKNLYLDGPAPTRAQQQQALTERNYREGKRQAWNELERQAAARNRNRWTWYSAIRDRLILAPEGAAGDALTVLFHQALDELREGEYDSQGISKCERLAIERREVEKLDDCYYKRLHQLQAAKRRAS